MDSCTGLSLDLAHVPFPLVIFALYSFSVINISHGYNNRLNPLGPLRKITEPGGSLGDPGHTNQEAHLVTPAKNK